MCIRDRLQGVSRVPQVHGPGLRLQRRPVAAELRSRLSIAAHLAKRTRACGQGPSEFKTLPQTGESEGVEPVSYTHLRAHETVLDIVCRLLLEKKKSDANKRASATQTTTKNHSQSLKTHHT